MLPHVLNYTKFLVQVGDLCLLAGNAGPITQKTKKGLPDSVHSVYSVVQKITRTAENAGCPLRIRGSFRVRQHRFAMSGVAFPYL